MNEVESLPIDPYLVGVVDNKLAVCRNVVGLDWREICSQDLYARVGIGEIDTPGYALKSVFYQRQ